jgi:hypothetical protein
MSGPFGSSQWMYATGFKVTNSLNFQSANSAQLSRTPSSAGNRRTFTFSTWIKRTATAGGDQYVFGTASEGDGFGFSANKIRVLLNGSSSGFLTSSTTLTDTSNFHSLIFAVDTTQSTPSNRVKAYLDGNQVSFDEHTSFPAINHDCDINNTEANFVGNGHGNQRINAKLAETNFIEGTQLDESSFGQTSGGVFIPIDTKNLTFGTNGFRLQYKQTGTGTASSSTVGADTSGNNNHLTSSGISSSDITTDAP